MGMTCIGVSRKSFQSFRKLEKEETMGSRTQDNSKVSNAVSKGFTQILEEDSHINKNGKDSPIKIAFPKGREETKSIIVDVEGKENNPNMLVEFMRQRPQSPIREEMERSRVCNIHPRMAKRYFNQPGV